MSDEIRKVFEKWWDSNTVDFEEEAFKSHQAAFEAGIKYVKELECLSGSGN